MSTSVPARFFVAMSYLNNDDDLMAEVDRILSDIAPDDDSWKTPPQEPPRPARRPASAAPQAEATKRVQKAPARSPEDPKHTRPLNWERPIRPEEPSRSSMPAHRYAVSSGSPSQPPQKKVKRPQPPPPPPEYYDDDPYDGRKKKPKKGKAVTIILVLIIIVCIVGLAIDGPLLYDALMEYHEAREEYAEVSESATFAIPTPNIDAIREQVLAASEEQIDEEELEQKVEEAVQEAQSTWVPLEVDWDDLRSKNSDVIAWIYSPDTMINYPVVQGTNNSYYLYHSVNGSYLSSGSIFANYQCELGNTLSNFILYGHHMKDNSMFGSLKYYKNESYYKEHPIMYLLTPEVTYRINIICGHIVESSSKNFPIFFSNDQEYREYLSSVLSSCSWSSYNTATTTQQLITLVTCDYTSGYADPRYIVQGMLEPIGVAPSSVENG